jgi:hypothetical protein
MTLSTDLRHGFRIARAEFVRSLRGYTRDTRRLLGLVLLCLLFGGSLLLTLPGVYLLGQRVRTVSAIPFLDQVALALPVGLLLLAVLRTLERIGGAEGEALLLTTVHPRAVVVGLVTAEVARLTLWFGVPVVLVVGVFAWGLGAPTLVLSTGLVATPLVSWAAVWGYAFGLAALRLLRRLPRLRRLLKAGGLVALVGLVVVSQGAGRYLAAEGLAVRETLSAVRFGPLTEYVGLAFVGTPLARPVGPGALVVLVGCLALTPVGLSVATRQASTLWFTDGAAPRTPAPDTARDASHFAPPRPFAWTRPGRIAWGFLVRAARRPQRLVHLLLVVFFLGPVGTTVLGSSGDGRLAVLAGTGVALGAYVSGAAFSLNPLGDDRDQTPVLLLTPTDPRTFLHGRAVAGFALGLPLAVLSPLALFAASSTPRYGLAFAAAGVGWCGAAAGFALGLGCAYPVYEERELWGVETVAPSTLVTMTYTLVVLFGTGLGLVVLWLVLAGHVVLSGLALAGVGTYLLLTLGVPVASYLYAVRRYRRRTVD